MSSHLEQIPGFPRTTPLSPGGGIISLLCPRSRTFRGNCRGEERLAFLGSPSRCVLSWPRVLGGATKKPHVFRRLLNDSTKQQLRPRPYHTLNISSCLHHKAIGLPWLCPLLDRRASLTPIDVTTRRSGKLWSGTWPPPNGTNLMPGGSGGGVHRVVVTDKQASILILIV